MLEIPSYCFLKPTRGKTANRQDRKISPFLSSWPGLCRTSRIQIKTKTEGKACILLFPSSLNRTGHLKLLPNRTAEEFIKHLNWFLTRKGHPRKIYSYNGQAFSAAVKKLNGMVKHVLFIRFSQSRMFQWIQSNVKLDVSNKSNKVS